MALTAAHCLDDGVEAERTEVFAGMFNSCVPAKEEPSRLH